MDQTVYTTGTDIQGLHSISFIGRAPHADVLDTIARTCTGLTSLVLGAQPGELLGTLPPDYSNRLITRPSSMKAISRLTSLRRLALTLGETAWDADEATTVLSLGALTGLTELRLAGEPVSPNGARSLLRAMRGLRHVALVFNVAAGRLYDRKDLAMWKLLQQVELRLRERLLERDIQLLTLGLTNSLRSLHLRSCLVSPYSLTALSDLVALRELSFDGWDALGLPAVAAAAAVQEGGAGIAAATAGAVRIALVGLLSGPLGGRLEVLRMDLGDPSKEIYGDMARMAATWSHGSLRVLHLVNASAYCLATSGALACLSGLRGLKELRVAVQGPPCRNGSCLLAAWLPSSLTSLELAGIHLPCGEEGLRGAEAAAVPVAAAGGDKGASGPGRQRGSGTQQRGDVPVSSSSRASDGHGRLRHLQRLSLHGCRFDCCGHLKAALGPELLTRLASLELNDVVGLSEEHLSGLGALTDLTNLSVCALGHPCISSASLAHVSGLTALTRLRWHAGDTLDAPPHPAVLKPLRRLAVLDVSSGQWWRMNRWHVNAALAETLPMCEVAVS